jgi:hypothetical protein
MSTFTIPVPNWIARLLPSRLIDDLDRRSHLTGSASTSLANGVITIRADRLSDDTQNTSSLRHEQ